MRILWIVLFLLIAQNAYAFLESPPQVKDENLPIYNWMDRAQTRMNRPTIPQISTDPNVASRQNWNAKMREIVIYTGNIHQWLAWESATQPNVWYGVKGELIQGDTK